VHHDVDISGSTTVQEQFLHTRAKLLGLPTAESVATEVRGEAANLDASTGLPQQCTVRALWPSSVVVSKTLLLLEVPCFGTVSASILVCATCKKPQR